MKRSRTNIAVIASCILAVILTPLFVAHAEPPGKGGGRGAIRTIKSKKDAESLPKGARVAMACSKCQTVQIQNDKKGFLAWFTPKTKHVCPGCKGKWELKPAGGRKGGKTSKYVHTCSNCGDDSVYCCSVPPKKTKGMEKKDKRDKK